VKLQIDSYVRGKAGLTDKIVEGRVFHVSKTGSAAIVDPDGKQHIIYEPEVLDKPRSLIARTDIPRRLRDVR